MVVQCQQTSNLLFDNPFKNINNRGPFGSPGKKIPYITKVGVAGTAREVIILIRQKNALQWTPKIKQIISYKMQFPERFQTWCLY
jgi:hypothetical protein